MNLNTDMEIKNFKIYTKKDLKSLSKNQIIELYLENQELFLSLLYKQENLENKIDKIAEKLKEPKKGSKNSSVSPSMDLSRSNKNNDKKANKKGPKKGHKGKSRKLKLEADIEIISKIEKNPRTGEELTSNSNSYHLHQIIELQPMKLVVINIKRQTTTGEDGKTVTAPNPAGVNNYDRFGSNFKAFISLLRYRYYMPWNKIEEFILEFSNEKISQGLLANIFEEVKEKLEDDYNDIKEEIKNSEVVCGDETGEKIDGEKAWGWVFRTEDSTIYSIEETRSSEVPNEILGKDFQGILVSDFWGGYSENKFKAKAYQKCLDHLDRDLKFVIDIEKQKGINKTEKIRRIFLAARELKKEELFGSKKYKNKVRNIENMLDEELNDKDFGTKAGNRLRKRMIKYRDHLLTFLYYENVPPDNNGSERDIRKFVGLRKVSGSFRSEKIRGPTWQSIIMSIIETKRKRGLNYFDYIKNKLADNNDLLFNSS